MNQKSSPFVAKLDLALTKQLKRDLEAQGFEFSEPAYTLFSAKKKGVVCTVYQSGKLVVQGKDKEEFIEFYLEPHILKTFTYTHGNTEETKYPERVGVDEAGKGDLFGPLCIAGVWAKQEDLEKLKSMGVKDSKKIHDKDILLISKKIRKEFSHHIVRINPLKYNELYDKFKNLNHLLAWGHATVIENLVAETGSKQVVIDQFAHEKVVLNALNQKGLDINLTQRHRGEEETIVAAASILARAGFLEGLYNLRKTYEIEFPKGASKQVVTVGKEFVRRYGKEALKQVAKWHFKTIEKIS